MVGYVDWGDIGDIGEEGTNRRLEWDVEELEENWFTGTSVYCSGWGWGEGEEWGARLLRVFNSLRKFTTCLLSSLISSTWVSRTFFHFLQGLIQNRKSWKETHTHTHTYIFIQIFISICTLGHFPTDEDTSSAPASAPLGVLSFFSARNLIPMTSQLCSQ